METGELAEVGGPERTCVGCRRRRPQSELVRCALTPLGEVVVSRTVPGRGAWLCDPPAACFELAVRRRAFERAWRRTIPSEVLARAGERLADRAVDGEMWGRDDEKG